jgi:hypothetical protein
MYICELVVPGTWLACSDQEARHNAQSLLYILRGSLSDAAICLSLFEATPVSSITSVEDSRRESDIQRAAHDEIVQELIGTLPLGSSSTDERNLLEVRRDEIQRNVRRRMWAQGVVPHSYRNRVRFIHAKSFLYALDTIQKTIEQLTKHPCASNALDAVLAAWKGIFPHLVQVRDSAHHVEDRAQGKAKNNKIVLRPVHNGAISAPGGALNIDFLNGNRYGGTLADGSFGEVEVSASSLTNARDLVQRALEAFDWSGPQDHEPR